MSVPLDFAFGSGKTGMTYVFVVKGSMLVELRSSYFPHEKKWYVTPGQERLNAGDVGGPFPRPAARACFLCHAVTLPDDTVTPQARFYGVGCESCHGPGSSHIAVIRAGGSSETLMESMESWSGTRVNELCGKCHGTEAEAREQHLSSEMTTRLQAVGLARSQCFKQSKDTLSCITCHDPHTNVGANARIYESVCLTCHSGSTRSRRPPALRLLTIRSCPVNQRAGCIACHMPKRPAITSSKIPTYMSDHLIRVFSKSR